MNYDIFPFKIGSCNYLYSPFDRKVAEINNDAMELLQLCKENPQLYKEEKVQFLFKSIGIKENHNNITNTHIKPSKYLPTSLTLSLTSKCSLRCEYCYANGGSTSRDLPLSKAKKAIDYIINNAINTNKKSVSLSFHGEGEPTSNWNLLLQCVSYFKDQSIKNNLKETISMSTNCFFSKEKASYIIKNFNSISASFDGTPDLQNKNRKTAAFSGSSDVVIRNLLYFDEHNFDYGIRATVLPSDFENEMEKSVVWISENLKCKNIRFEPVQPRGRGVKFKDQLYSSTFIDGYRTAYLVGLKYNINVDYSICSCKKLKSSFCGAYGDNLNFLLTTEGNITTCNDILSHEDIDSKIFFVGYIDNKCDIVLYDDRINYLKSQNVSIFDVCKNCLAKWHCGGDCIARKTEPIEKDSFIKSNKFRCTINKQLIREDIYLNILKNDSFDLKK